MSKKYDDMREALAKREDKAELEFTDLRWNKDIKYTIVPEGFVDELGRPIHNKDNTIKFAESILQYFNER